MVVWAHNGAPQAWPNCFGFGMMQLNQHASHSPSAYTPAYTAAQLLQQGCDAFSGSHLCWDSHWVMAALSYVEGLMVPSCSSRAGSRMMPCWRWWKKGSGSGRARMLCRPRNFSLMQAAAERHTAKAGRCVLCSHCHTHSHACTRTRCSIQNHSHHACQKPHPRLQGKGPATWHPTCVMGHMKPRGTSLTGSSSTSSGITSGSGQVPAVGTGKRGTLTNCRTGKEGRGGRRSAMWDRGGKGAEHGHAWQQGTYGSFSTWCGCPCAPMAKQSINSPASFAAAWNGQLEQACS